MALTTEFQTAYDRFLSAWLEHEDLRHGGSIADLVASRIRLDGMRYEMAVLAKQIG